MKKYALLALLCAVAAAVVIAWGLGDPSQGSDAPKARVALVLARDTGTYIMKLKSGAQDAATDQQAELSIFVAQGALPEQVLSGGYTAVILDVESGIPMSDAQKALPDVPLVSIGGMGGDYTVLPDPLGDGRLAAAAISIPAGGRVALLGGEAEPERLSGALSALSGMECLTLAYREGGEVFEQIASLSPNAVIALTEQATLQAAEARSSGLLPGNIALSGFAQGDAASELLESGALDALTVPVPYATGYQAVTAAMTQKSVTTGGRAITLETLFDAENVAIVFPLLQ